MITSVRHPQCAVINLTMKEWMFQHFIVYQLGLTVHSDNVVGPRFGYIRWYKCKTFLYLHTTKGFNMHVIEHLSVIVHEKGAES